MIENEDLVSMFQVNKIIKDTESDIIVQMKDGHKFRIMAKGAEQKIRGALWEGKRPGLIVGDDLENDEIVMNQERRTKFKRWFKGAVMPALSVTGKIRLVGTILHLDSLLENFMPQDWSKFTVHEDLKSYSTNDKPLWKGVRYRAHNHDYSQILWPDRFNKKTLQALQQDYINDGIGDVYNQEYLNNPIDENRSYFKRSNMLADSDETIEDILSGKKELNYYIGVDLAISEKQRADWTCFVVGGMDSDNILHIVEVVRGRMDARMIVDTIFTLYSRWRPEIFLFEKGQLERAIGPFLREESLKRGMFPQTDAVTPSADKQVRGRSIQGRTQVHGVKFNKKTDWYTQFEQECLQFPKSKWDDQVDAFGLLGMALDKFQQARTEQERDFDDYMDEVRRDSDLLEQGRNSTTGY